MSAYLPDPLASAGAPPTHTAFEVASELSGDLRTTLALLAGAGDDLAEVSLGMLPYGSRMTLLGYRAISPHQAELEGVALVRLTAFGRDLIDACAAAAATVDVQERIAALRKARAARAALRPGGIRAVSARG